MSKKRIQICLSGQDNIAMVKALLDLDLWPDMQPQNIAINFSSVPVKKVDLNWFEEWIIPNGDKNVLINFDKNYDQMLAFQANKVVNIVFYLPFTIESVLEILEKLPFTIASFATLYPEEWSSTDYIAPSFGDGHLPHGWACAFKGEGHRRLVSRRWLEQGPWYLWRKSDDLTLVQFHSLQADPLTALKQAKVAHDWMGITEEGGFIQTNYIFSNDFLEEVKPLYYPDQRLAKIVVNDREVTETELLNVCAARYYHLWKSEGAQQSVDRIAYMYVDPEQARNDLYSLWIRDLECWVLTELGEQIRIDLDFDPKPVKPDWVMQLQP